VHSFCGAVEAGSRLLRAYLEYPVLVGGSLAIILGATAIAALVVLKDLARSPLVPKGTSGFLRHRRSLGQMIRAAVIVYSRRPRLFLGITAVYIPANLAASLAQSKVLSWQPFRYVDWMLNDNRASEIVTGLLVGGLASIVVYMVVVPATIVAVADLDAGRATDVRLAYRRAARRVLPVIIARARTLVLMGALGISIIGLPLAIWLAVRWYFVEEAVLLDGKSQWRAPAASGIAVQGRWPRAARHVLCFGLFGAFAGPLLAFALLLGTGIEPSLVNVIAGLFHTAALPFTTIGLCLTYRDLQERSVPGEPVDSTPGPSAARLLRRAGGAAQWVLYRFEGRPRGE
jgi:hypothetical protein